MVVQFELTRYCCLGQGYGDSLLNTKYLVGDTARGNPRPAAFALYCGGENGAFESVVRFRVTGIPPLDALTLSMRPRTSETSTMNKSGRHVIPNLKGGWAVRKSGAERATRIFTTQQEAETFARDLAKKEHVNLYIHRADGTIQQRDSYGNDSLSQ